MYFGTCSSCGPRQTLEKRKQAEIKKIEKAEIKAKKMKLKVVESDTEESESWIIHGKESQEE
ncbi:MAG: hypothetical protein ACRYE7_00240 [Janthinobacterium lividum]